MASNVEKEILDLESFLDAYVEENNIEIPNLDDSDDDEDNSKLLDDNDEKLLLRSQTSQLSQTSEIEMLTKTNSTTNDDIEFCDVVDGEIVLKKDEEAEPVKTIKSVRFGATKINEIEKVTKNNQPKRKEISKSAVQNVNTQLAKNFKDNLKLAQPAGQPQPANISQNPLSPINPPKSPTVSSDEILTSADDLNNPQLVARTFIGRAMKFPAKSKDLANLCNNLSEKITEFLPSLMKELQLQYLKRHDEDEEQNNKKILDEDQFCGFAYFLFDLWLTLINPVTGESLHVLIEPVITLLGELLDKPYAEKQYFKNFSRVIPSIPLEYLNNPTNNLLPQLRTKTLTAALNFQTQQKTRIRHKIEAQKKNTKGKNENIFQFSRKNYLRAMEFYIETITAKSNLARESAAQQQMILQGAY